MRYVLCAWLFVYPLLAQQNLLSPPKAAPGNGAFYVNGIVYQYIVGHDYTVVAAAHSVVNHKFLGVKLRVYNHAEHSVTVKPEEVEVVDAIGSHTLTPVSGVALANRMRKRYNMARYSVNSSAGGEPEPPITSDMLNPQFLEMMRAAHANAAAMSRGQGLLYTDTPGALDSDDQPARPPECGQVCRLRNREAQGTDALTQLQRQSSPDAVEQSALLANTIPPGTNVVGVLYYPLGKLVEGAGGPDRHKKRRLVRLRVPVGGENFQFLMPVE
ncbi:MAG TPA: hypothetical protein VKV05_13255 [Terriglobales bacterium]|nr:hypothetical protein [Terriglobales bacterium]